MILCADDSAEINDMFKDMGYDYYFVRQLQRIHDNYEVKEWEEEFQFLAKEHGLVYTPTF